jgi:hypothetical protein
MYNKVMACSKVKLVVGAFVGLVYLLASPRAVFAQCLINIPDWSSGQVTTCLEPGGTIGLVGSYGNFGNIYAQTAAIVSQYNQTQSSNNRVTLEYRLYNDARPSTEAEIQSVIAIMQQNPINAPAMLRVNNEWTDNYVWTGMDFASRVSNYLETQYAAWQTIRDSGGGIVLVDGMLDYWSGVDLDQVINAINSQIQSGNYPGWNSWADTFDVLAINGYFEPGSYQQNHELILGNYTLSGILSHLPEGTPWRFSEFGYKLPGQRPTYDNLALLEQTVVDLVSWLANHQDYAQFFAGLNIFTRDPHSPDSANIAAAIMEIVARNPALGSALAALENFGLQDPAAFQAWLDQLLQDGILVECKDTSGAVIGYAPTQDQCAVPLQMPQLPEGLTNTCSAQGAEESGLFRPAPCKNCSLDVPSPTNSCAEPFTLIRPETWTCADLTGCPDPAEGRYFIKEVTWGADFFLNTQDTKVPFAGYRDIVTDDKDQVKNLNYYLADYFEGTTLLDDQPYDQTDAEQVRAGILNAGVFRKLAPLEVQDRLREQLIVSGLNYEVSDGKTTKRLQDFWPNRPLPPARYPTGYFPPDRNGPDSVALYGKWVQSDWGKLWQRIPLFTREDAPGKVTLAIEHNPGQLRPSGQAGSPLTSYSSEFPMAFPHLARVFEGSDNLNQLLLPTIQAARAEALVPPTGGEPTPCDSIFGEGIETALGCMPTTAIGVASWFIQYGSSLAGGIALLLMGYGAFLFITSAGNEEQIAQGKTIMTAAIIGLLVVVGGVFFLRLITVQLLRIPGFSQAKPTPAPAPIQLTAAKPLVALAQGVGNTLKQTKQLFASTQLASSQPILLAQAGQDTQTGSTCNEMNIIQTVDQDGQIHFAVEETLGNSVNMKCYYRDTTVTITYSLNGSTIGSCTGFFPIVNNNPFDDYDDPLLTVCDPGLSVDDVGSGQLSTAVSFSGGLMGGSGPECGGSDASQSAGCSCTTSFDAQGNPTTTCMTGAAQEVVKGCTNASNLNAECSGDNPQEDRNPNDPACCDAQAHVDVPDYRIVAFSSKDDYYRSCCDPAVDPGCPEDADPLAVHNTQMTRKVSVKLEIPYLEEIWDDSTNEEFGFFNLFRPAHFPSFPNDDALSNIRYQLTSPGATINPPEGQLYYPYLGGIHQTKKCISEQFLLPKALQPETNYCQFWDDYLNSQPTYNPDQPSGFSVDDGSELDQMDCQNADFTISDTAKQSAIATANQSWPENLLEERWGDVAQQAKDHGWNPACVVALWVEESGGSDLKTTGAKYSLGCEGATSTNPDTNLNQSLDCFFSRQEHEFYSDLEPGSREWWLVYAEGPNNSGVFDGPQANFPKNLYSWYRRLSY